MAKDLHLTDFLQIKIADNFHKHKEIISVEVQKQHAFNNGSLDDYSL